ncbi:glycoside hydrolase [Cellvibrio zantedeschiae]|uniref:Glycoside hydrolase n=1 Tax=Cellvibrio zantedeschiae TaxID=1237077 RepID=A0ABQ3BD32_9GAMM|nr:glycoside hydrolase 43 family protein [Cellvibrio zantedeschiae]GGY84830.1 glycoside hydrolase [Cellvibrio zantedeschiae]
MNIRILSLAICLIPGLTSCTTPSTHEKSTSVKAAWQPDLGNGFYKNAIIHADYSDPDAIRVDDMFYMTSSSFNSAPGLPLLQSKDMVNWELVGHALPQQVPLDVFAKPQHGKGVWAPCLRYHDGKFWIFYPDPDFGIYVMTAEKFTGPWSAPHLLLAGKGIIDPTPLWDDDGKAYLLHAWAKSRAGINNMLTLRKMSPDARTMLDDKAKVVIDGNKIANYKTLEGPKFYKHNGYYYVFAPAGGVETGWQSVFRSKTIEGPYEDKIVMEQGKSPTNGPHQGAWVRAQDGSDWFFHFQDKRAYGRIVHLQPMHWLNDWPVIGEDKTNSGTGEPVTEHKKPIAGRFAIKNPATTDEFSSPKLGYQWQWNANWKADWYSLSAQKGKLRLFAVKDDSYQKTGNLWDTPSLLLQKLPAENFVVTTQLDTSHLQSGDSAGLIMYGFDYQWLGIKATATGQQLVLVRCEKAEANCKEQTLASLPLSQQQLSLQMNVSAGGKTQFAYSLDNKNFTAIGDLFTAAMGRWVGAQMGVFSLGENGKSFVDLDYFRVTPE